MLRFRKGPRIPITASQFRIGDPNPIAFATGSSDLRSGPPVVIQPPDSSEDETSSPPSTRGPKNLKAPTRNLASKRKSKKPPVSHQRLWLYGTPIFLCCLLAFSYLPSFVRFAEQRFHCVLPQSGRWSDWLHTTLSCIIIPFGYGCTSLNAGAIVTPKLTVSGIDSVPPSAVLSNTAGACWSFRGKSGTFGIVLDTPNVIPSHVAIHHWLSNSSILLSRAPHQVTVWGLVDGEMNMKIFSQSRHSFTSALTRTPRRISKEGIFLPLAEFEFDITRSLHQVFPFHSEALSLGIDFGVIVFEIRSNWGADITSLCSFHVYGRAALVE